ncbi:hypothetical protein HHL16_07940 [Pseudoflavitalea sp. G-6-1-2]|uniref:sensor histidine kinase n=1 Tax=Pseudoflavitalea sp. G-6-1-2 TaxID=2728841 RepID=UPI00146F885F|nr:ATP-binding protein [Pseudoflavitalea sp. G-6-1-2]NML20800.1 hypothetical protein [Pseudoflavitalea sp. G-6-1-2]
MPKVCILLFVALLLCHCFASAQNSPYRITHFSTNDGLPQNSVTNIEFDRWGFCWLGTEMGAVRFDGRHFTTFNSENISGIHSDRLSIAKVDDNGDLYFKNEKLELVGIRQPAPGIAPIAKHITDDNIWLPNKGGKAVSNSQIANRSRELFRSTGFTNLSSSGLNLGNGGIYFVERSQLFYFNGKDFKMVDSFPGNAWPAFIAVDDHLLLLFDNHSIIALKNGVRVEKSVTIKGPLLQDPALRKGDFLVFYSNGQTYLFAEKKLYGFFMENGQVFSKVLLDNLDIPVPGSLYYHQQQNKLYIGSLVSGLYIISFPGFKVPVTSGESLNEGFYAQSLTPGGELLCNRYLYKMDGSAERLPMNRYIGPSLFVDKHKQVYYGDHPALFRYDLNSKINCRLMALDSRPASIFCDQTDSSTIIVGTSLSVGKMKNDSLLLVRKLPGTPMIMSHFQTGRDSFVIATQSGVKWFDFNSGKVYRSVLDSVYIRSVYPESNGRVWISTQGKGFYLYQNDKLHSFPIRSSGGLKTIHAFVDDGRGNFWLTTNDGLFTVKKQSLIDYAAGIQNDVYYYRFGKDDGLPSNEFNGGCTPAFCWLKDSLLSLPTIAGLAQFYPHRITFTYPDRPVYINALLLNNNRLLYEDAMQLELEPDYSRLSLNVAVPYFGNRENLQLLYMIEGLDREWQTVPDDGTIIVNRLQAGNYRIVVKKRNDAGEPSPMLSFTVKPWFYQTWWFYSLLVLLVVAALLLTSYFREKLLHERNRRLQEIINRQTQDLSNTVKQLKDSEQALKESNVMKDNVTTMVLHDLRSPIRFLHTITKQLMKKRDTMAVGERNELLALLKNSTASLNDFTEQFFTWAASQHKDFRISVESFPIQELLNEMQDLYADIAMINGNRLIVIPSDAVAKTDRQLLAIIIRNLVDNANKSTFQGTVTIAVSYAEDKLEISVSDTGKGLDIAAMNSFYEGNAPGNQGNGSTIVKTLLEKIGGKLRIGSVKGEGTTFVILLDRYG